MDLIEEIQFDNIFSFAYSPRKFTQAATLPARCRETSARKDSSFPAGPEINNNSKEQTQCKEKEWKSL